MKQGASFAKKQGTLIALACAAAFAVPQAAVAQVATPDFGSGKGLSLSVDFVIGLASKIANDATSGIVSNSKRRTEVWSSSSSVYFKGSEKIGGSVIQGWGFVITWDYDPDEYNRRGANEVGQTIIGVTTPAGAFFLGVQDNPFKQLGSVNVATTSTFGNGLSQSGNLGTPGFRTGTAKGSKNGDAEGGFPGNTTSTMSFYRLNSNSVNWYSPSWNGFKLYAQWVPGDSDIPAGITTVDVNAWSLGATFATGPFNAGIVYEKRKDYQWGSVLTGNNFGAGSGAAGSGTDSSDDAWVFTMGYQLGNFKIGGYYQKMEYSQSHRGGTLLPLTDLEVDSWYLGVRWRSGPHEVGTFYFRGKDYDCNGNAGAATVALVGFCENETGVKAYGIGWRYTVSKQLRFFVSASRYDNDDNAQYSGHSSAARVGVGNPTNPAGLKLTNYSVGVTGSF
jgi:predicted porin